MRPLDGNPLLALHRDTAGDPGGRVRADALREYAFAVPTDEALDAIGGHSPRGVIEIGAGTGYWARLLHDRGVDVVAFDLKPAPALDNAFFPGTDPWFEIAQADELVATRHPERTLLLVWPTREDWALVAVDAFAAAGGTRIAFVGEGAGGRMGNEAFQARLGFTQGCPRCEYGVQNAPCVCGVDARWDVDDVIELPHWGGYEDDLYLLTRR